jgi:exosome complex component RRP41
MRDLVVACAAGKVENTIVLDLMDTEDKVGSADVPVALMPNLNAITLLQMDGILSLDEFESSVNLALDGCKQIYAMQKEALKTKYVEVKDGSKEEAEE